MSVSTLDTGAFAETFERARARREPAAWRRLREEAFARFSEIGFPTLKQEEWRFTNVAPVARTRFAAPAIPDSRTDRSGLAAEIARFRLEGTAEFVFVDGRFSSELSAARAQAGVHVESLARAQGTTLAAVEPVLGWKAAWRDHPFLALSAALFEDGAAIVVDRGAIVPEPIHLIFYSTRADEPTFSMPRTVIVAGERSEVAVVESFAGAAGAVYLTCPVTELVAGPGAVVDHSKLQRESRKAFHLSGIAIEAARASVVTTHSFSLGGAIVRHDINARLVGEGAEVTLNGLYLVEGRQVVDTHMRVDHVAAQCASHEWYKGVLDGQSRAVFNGRIHVHPGAQKTNAKQTNRNLLLSPEALAQSNPQLEIFADDVRCTHGSTVGQLDDLAVFYLRSRGIGLEAARSLLTYAFASDLVERVKVPALKRELQEFLFGWIPQGEVVREAV